MRHLGDTDRLDHEDVLFRDEQVGKDETVRRARTQSRHRPRGSVPIDEQVEMLAFESPIVLQRPQRGTDQGRR